MGVQFMSGESGFVALTYHQKAFDLIGVTPRLSSQAGFWLDQVEREHGVTLAPSLRELYSIVCARDLLLGAMRRPEQRRTNLLKLPLYALSSHPPQDHLPIAYDEQSTLEYTVQLRAAVDDPPVYSNYRSAHPEIHARHKGYREVHTDTLSAFIYWLLWDRLAASYGVWFAHPSNILKVAFVRSLEHYFQAVPVTRTTTEVTYRFQAAGAKLILTAEVYNGFAMNPILHVRAHTATTFRAALVRMVRAGYFGAASAPDNPASARILETVVV
jgi:hypothetical protein